MIEGVKTKRLKVIADERGRLMEILRADDEAFEAFGQVYMTTAYPGVVKGWHYHKTQSDNMAVVRGMMKIVLYDAREGSRTFGEVNEFFAGEHNPILVHIPPLVYHGFKCISEVEAIVVNTPTRTYDYRDPDEYRISPHESGIPYRWDRKDG
ncbi:MAG: dTDP-4-dehydrorhamnose 3,5-epimerase [Syntrophaceae bacterium PtaU1.Bin231]|nr:MAG: dTDP-4-dehydrorhamnose 3,5-epimerase [Syntrophaceae bacterium PtaU1.Bin231]HOG16167.1 dTDP-4-dehydrorhamnose 3,5-epimerase family protein [Syntrophales bacterium]